MFDIKKVVVGLCNDTGLLCMVNDAVFWFKPALVVICLFGLINFQLPSFY
jgi:hypothetical protein